MIAAGHIDAVIEQLKPFDICALIPISSPALVGACAAGPAATLRSRQGGWLMATRACEMKRSGFRFPADHVADYLRKDFWRLATLDEPALVENRRRHGVDAVAAPEIFRLAYLCSKLVRRKRIGRVQHPVLRRARHQSARRDRWLSAGP